MRKLIIIASLVLLSGCVSNQLKGMQSIANHIATHCPQGLTVVMQTRGKDELYEASCSGNLIQDKKEAKKKYFD